MKYFLVGYMACGKTRRGKSMAEELGIRFIDLDAYVVDRGKRRFLPLWEKPGFGNWKPDT